MSAGNEVDSGRSHQYTVTSLSIPGPSKSLTTIITVGALCGLREFLPGCLLYVGSRAQTFFMVQYRNGSQRPCFLALFFGHSRQILLCTMLFYGYHFFKTKRQIQGGVSLIVSPFRSDFFSHAFTTSSQPQNLPSTTLPLIMSHLMSSTLDQVLEILFYFNDFSF